MDALATIVKDSIDAFSDVPMNMVLKTANEGRSNNTTMTNDSTLVLTGLEASASYYIKIVLFIDTDATAWFDFRVVVTGSDRYRIHRKTLPPSTTAYENIKTDVDTGPTIFVTSSGTNGGFVQLEMLVRMSAAGGDKKVELQWCQDSNSATPTTVLAGSYLEWQKV